MAENRVSRETLRLMERHKTACDIYLTRGETGGRLEKPLQISSVRVAGSQYETCEFLDLATGKKRVRLTISGLGFHGTFLKINGIRNLPGQAYSVTAYVVPMGCDPGELPLE